MSQPTADCLEIPYSRARGSFCCRSHSPLSSHTRVSLYGISLLVAVWLHTCLVARIKRVLALLVLLFASRPGCTLCSQSAFQNATHLAATLRRIQAHKHHLRFCCSFCKKNSLTPSAYREFFLGQYNILQINSGFMLTKNSKSFAVNLHIKI